MSEKPFDNAPEEIKRLAFFLPGFYAETDRGAALMAGSILDEVLIEILQNFLVDGKCSEELLRGFHAPLGTFSAKMLACYSLGLIEEREYLEIGIIRKIRNEFGHSFEEISFESERIKAQIQRLPFQQGSGRSTFNDAVANLLGELLWRSYYVKGEKRALKDWPNKGGFIKR